ncbi:hypothetical protein D3C85_374520 [compost metagenome]
MKGPKALKRYVAKHRKHLKACHWDDLFIFQMERCKNWYKRDKNINSEEFCDDED